MAIVGVVPAAGYATRLEQLPCSKELVPVAGRPVIEYVVDRMRVVPAVEIRVVTRPDKRDVVEHAHRLGLNVVEARPPTAAASIHVGAAGLDADDVVLVGFPDTVWEPEDGFVALVAALADGPDVALGCFRSEELERSDVVVADEEGVVRSVQVKPRRPASEWIWGCAAARVGALAGLEEHTHPGTLFDRLARAGRVRAVRLEGEFLDIGTPEAVERLGMLA